MKKLTVRILTFLVLAVALATASCSNSPQERLADVIAKTNAEIGGTEISTGCVCDSVVYEDGNMVYYFNFPGLDLGDSLTDDQFLSAVRPSIDELLKGNLGDDAEGSEIAELRDLLIESNSGVEFKMNFSGRNLTLAYSPDEIKSLLGK